MKRLVMLVVLCLSQAGCMATATKMSEMMGYKPVRSEYDRFKDETTVFTELLAFDNVGPSHLRAKNASSVNVQPKITYKGTVRPRDYSGVTARLVISAKQVDKFGVVLANIGNTDLRLILDGNERLLLKAEYLTTTVGSVADGNHWYVPVTVGQMEQLARAKQIEAQIGPIEFGFDDTGIQPLRELLKADTHQCGVTVTCRNDKP